MCSRTFVYLACDLADRLHWSQNSVGSELTPGEGPEEYRFSDVLLTKMRRYIFFHTALCNGVVTVQMDIRPIVAPSVVGQRWAASFPQYVFLPVARNSLRRECLQTLEIGDTPTDFCSHVNDVAERAPRSLAVWVRPLGW